MCGCHVREDEGRRGGIGLSTHASLLIDDDREEKMYMNDLYPP